MINPSTINLDSLPSVDLRDRKMLPEIPAIYFVIDGNGRVQYIGRSVNPRKRWIQHQTRKSLDVLPGVRIAYLDCPEDLLVEVESALINWFKPPLNGGKISYAPHQPMTVVREIRVTVSDLEKRIKDLRLASGRSVQSLATEAGISTAYWYQIEKGERTYITEPVLRGIEEALGADLEVSFDDRP